jgi:hypothetical protein
MLRLAIRPRHTSLFRRSLRACGTWSDKYVLRRVSRLSGCFDSSRFRCSRAHTELFARKQVLTLDTASRCESVVPLTGRQRGASSQRAKGFHSSIFVRPCSARPWGSHKRLELCDLMEHNPELIVYTLVISRKIMTIVFYYIRVYV